MTAVLSADQRRWLVTAKEVLESYAKSLDLGFNLGLARNSAAVIGEIPSEAVEPDASCEHEVETLALERDQLRERLAPFTAECEAVGIPESAPGLVRHHRGTASLDALTGISGETLRLVRLLAEEVGVIVERRPAGGPA